jgi:hypothetical protein
VTSQQGRADLRDPGPDTVMAGEPLQQFLKNQVNADELQAMLFVAASVLRFYFGLNWLNTHV